MQFKRSERVQELLRHEISLLVQQIPNPKLGFVTITGVHLSDDLTDAKVFYSVLGTEEDRQNSTAVLRHSIPSIRHDLGKKLESLRKIPYINFIYDDTAEKAQKVSLILNQLAAERKDEPAPEELPAPERPARKKSPRAKKAK
jgi:ribosome-binding factor A